MTHSIAVQNVIKEKEFSLIEAYTFSEHLVRRRRERQSAG
jgi:hypothetical protein